MSKQGPLLAEIRQSLPRRSSLAVDRDQGQRRQALRLGLLSYLKCIIDFYSEISYCTFQLGMSQK